MTKHIVVVPVLAAAGMVLPFGIGTAHADTQPADLGNVANIDRGASTPGPHCHFVLPAGGGQGFDSDITGADHQGHTQTVGVFTATSCP
jgi:hypothetical protein